MEINELAVGSNCYGCGACAASCPMDAITMIADSKGFNYPHIDKDKCISCNKCKTVCENVHCYSLNSDGFGVFALQHKNEDVLGLSSSGGAFIALSDYILKQRGIVVGAVYDPSQNRVVHLVADNDRDRNNMCGSKYVQSDITGVFNQVKSALNSYRLVLFTGTPCQISALYAYLGGNHYKDLYTVDVLCHGVPSPLVFLDFLKFQESLHKSSIVDYQFRSKKFGYEYTANIVFENGKSDCSLNAKRILKLYTLNMRESCYSCQFASKNRVSDISIGDLWYRPNNVKVKKHIGCSTVIINSIKGRELFEKIKDYVILYPINIDADKRQALSHPVVRKKSVDDFWNCYFVNGIEAVLDKYAKVTFKSKVFFLLIRFLHFTHQFWLIEKIKEHIRIS